MEITKNPHDPQKTVPPPSRWDVFKAVLWRPVEGLATLMATLATIAGIARATILRHYFDGRQASAHPWAKIPDWSWQTWLAIWAFALLLIALEGCYQVVRKRTVEINGLVDTVNLLVGEVATLQALEESGKQRLSQVTEALAEAAKKHEKLEADNASLNHKIEEFKAQALAERPLLSFLLAEDKSLAPVPMPAHHKDIHGNATSSAILVPRVVLNVRNKRQGVVTTVTGYRLRRHSMPQTVRTAESTALAQYEEHTKIEITKELARFMGDSDDLWLRLDALAEANANVDIALDYDSDAGTETTDWGCFHVTTRLSGLKLYWHIGKVENPPPSTPQP